MENLKSVLALVIEKGLPALGGFVVGIAAGIGLMWWVFL
jgi:hypothetical protein